MRCNRGFTLIEMLSVIAILITLATLSLPTLSSLSNQAGRKGAVNLLLGTFEQARVAALTSGSTTYIGFANELLFNQPGSEYPYRAFVVFRDRTDTDTVGGTYVQLTRWMFLPKNISFKRERFSVVGNPSATVPYLLTLTDNSIAHLKVGDQIPAIAFNSTGTIQNPTGANDLHLFIYEGFFANNQDNFKSRDRTYFERISFQRFTGRAQLDITTIQ